MPRLIAARFLIVVDEISKRGALSNFDFCAIALFEIRDLVPALYEHPYHLS